MTSETTVTNRFVQADVAYFFFGGIEDGWAFKQKLEASEMWAGHTVAFVVDP